MTKFNKNLRKILNNVIAKFEQLFLQRRDVKNEKVVLNQFMLEIKKSVADEIIELLPTKDRLEKAGCDCELFSLLPTVIRSWAREGCDE